MKVNQYGWIEAQGKPGKAKVIIRAHNGVTRTLVITVADYARPAKFTNLDKVKKWNKTASSVLSKYRIEITSIAAWLERIKKEVRFLYEDNNLQYDYNVINFAPIETELTNLSKNTNMQIHINKGNLTFVIPLEKGSFFGAAIIYSDYNGQDDVKEGCIRVAPCWYFYDGRNDLD